MFFEASTRTACSFQSAMQKLGGTVLSIKPSDTSLTKGESLYGKALAALYYLGRFFFIVYLNGFFVLNKERSSFIKARHF